ncbi:cytochrome C biosynthesis protein, partial [Parabacteroides sp. OttesenSCG-928-G06]|nr:cytochrome C biosynthesis protein [Parabacteroides sp. OttesenSCG-928-G06]
MKKGRLYPTYIYLFWLFLVACNSGAVRPDKQADTLPRIFPDYTDVTFPSNIAAPNFLIEEEADSYFVEIGGGDRIYFSRKGKSNEVRINAVKWANLLKERSGKDFYIRIALKREGQWIGYKEIQNTISPLPIDPYLAYRLLYPGYELWNEMGIYQRDLTSYKVTPVIENKEVDKGCVNCHTFTQNSPETMMLHIRGTQGGTLIRRNGKSDKVSIKDIENKNPGTYAAWHPGGRYLALSANNVNQFFHSTGSKTIEVSDSESDLILFDAETGKTFTDSAFYGPEWMETFPAWNPAGDIFYYCRAPRETNMPPTGDLRYDLYRVAFDAANATFGEPECVYAAASEGYTVSHPRISPDGRYLMFCRFDYGTFSIWHPESELCLLDLTTNELREMAEVNSADVDSYHTWSSTGDWFVFSSKRIDGLWAHPHFAFFDKTTGKAGKPFLLPQKDPMFYKEFTR